MPRADEYQKAPEKYRQARREYYRTHREEELEKMKLYRQNNRGRLRKYWREWYKRKQRGVEEVGN